MFYSWRFDRALAALGYNPRYMPVLHRQAGLISGRSLGDTPQEAALLLMSVESVDRRRRPNSKLMQRWILQGKIDLNKPHVHEALHCLNNGQLP